MQQNSWRIIIVKRPVVRCIVLHVHVHVGGYSVVYLARPYSQCSEYWGPPVCLGLLCQHKA